MHARPAAGHTAKVTPCNMSFPQQPATCRILPALTCSLWSPCLPRTLSRKLGHVGLDLPHLVPALARQQCDGMPPLCSWRLPRWLRSFLCLKVSPLDPTAMGRPASRLPPPRCFAGRFPESLPCSSPRGCPPNLEECLPHNVRHCTAPRPPPPWQV